MAKRKIEPITAPSVLVAHRRGGHYFNPYETNFVVLPFAPQVPRQPESANKDESLGSTALNGDAAKSVADLQSQAVAENSHSARMEFSKLLLGLRTHQRAFFPVGFLWGRSALFQLDETQFLAAAVEMLPHLAVVYGELSELPTIARLDTQRQRHSYRHAYLKFFMALWLSQGDVNRLGDVRDVHMKLLANVVKPDGAWAPWFSLWNQKTVRSFSSAIGQSRGDPTFGQDIGRVLYSGRGARQTSPVANMPHLQWVEDQFERFLNEQKRSQKKQPRVAKRFLIDVLLKCDPADTTPDRAFCRANIERLLESAATFSTPVQRTIALGRIFEFGQWLFENGRGADGVEKIAFELTSRDIDRFRKQQPASTQPSKSEVAARPMPQRFHADLKAILTEGDFAWPKSLRHRVDGRLIYWITHIDPLTGQGEPVFCEVMPRMLLLMLDLPLRGIQARRLDSGEGDEEMWNPASRSWTANDSSHAGYWRRVGGRNPRRGVFRKIEAAGRNGDTITGFYINSNKTQDRDQLFDENSGYEIPWQFEEVLDNLSAMRRWQETYNPVLGPLSNDDTPAPLRMNDPSEIVRGALPERFYLFRYPLNPGERGKEAPPTYANFLQFFYLALEELERRLNLDNPDQPVSIITKRDPSGLPKGAIFTVHGMRSSTITSLYSQGVPIAVLSKLVAGHTTILMTLSYVKYEPAHVSEILTEARRKAVSSASADFQRTLSNASFAEAARMTARLQDDGLEQAKGQYSGSSFWGGMDIGICPNGGTLCGVGGEAVHKKIDMGKDRSPHRPVPGGPRNCVRCRFFMTGLPFLIPLWGHANMLSARLGGASARLEQRERDITNAKRERHGLSKTGMAIPQELARRLAALEAEWSADLDARDQALADFHATLVYIEKIRAIGDELGGSKLPMLLPEDGVPEVTGRESTRFELSDAVVQMSRFFPSLASADLERERDQFLDRVLYQEGYVPISLGPLSVEDRQKAADSLAAFLLGQLGAAEAQNLIDGKRTLADLGLQERFEDVAKRSVGRPLSKLAVPDAGGPRKLIELEVKRA